MWFTWSPLPNGFRIRGICTNPASRCHAARRSEVISLGFRLEESLSLSPLPFSPLNIIFIQLHQQFMKLQRVFISAAPMLPDPALGMGERKETEAAACLELLRGAF